jgi:hypothetical protein
MSIHGATLEVSRRRSVLRWLDNTNLVSSTPILVTLVMTKTRSSETSVFTRPTWRHISNDDVLHSHHRQNLKSYKTKLRLPFNLAPALQEIEAIHLHVPPTLIFDASV